MQCRHCVRPHILHGGDEVEGGHAAGRPQRAGDVAVLGAGRREA
jgi:hypothetical protein